MTTIEFKLEGFGKEYIENLLNLKDGEELKITGFPDRETLREFAARMLNPNKIISTNYISVVNEKYLTYVAVKQAD